MGRAQCLVSVTLHPSGSVAGCLRLIRAFDPDRSLGELSAAVKAGKPAFSFDLYHYDALEELTGTDRKKQFRRLLDELAVQGARPEMTLAQGGRTEALTLEGLDDLMAAHREIELEVERDIWRETEGTEPDF